MSKEISDTYQFTLEDIGKRKIIVKYKDLVDEVNIVVLGPNLRSTEADGSHLYLKTSDGKYLCVKG